MTGTAIDLPSIEECRGFLEAINAERVTGGLEPLKTLDFDGAKPRSVSNCLSARNCYAPLGYVVGAGTAYDWRHGFTFGGDRSIPAAIMRVTDVFDAASDDPTLLMALRGRLVKAGCVSKTRWRERLRLARRSRTSRPTSRAPMEHMFDTGRP